jgi:glycine betaine/proline transport system substrate-binding protein
MLTEPKYDPAKYVMVQPSDDADWYEKSKVASKDALKKVQIAWSNSLQGALAGDCRILRAFRV